MSHLLSHAQRRRGRQLARLAASALTPSMYPTAPVASAFWFDGIKNFGDALTPWLLRHAGIVPLQSTAARANLVGVGSILEMVPRDYSGAIWGSGLLLGQPTELPYARILAVRGELTRDLISAPGSVSLGDPGVLVSKYLPRPASRWAVGLIPHHVHESDAFWTQLASRHNQSVRIINVRRSPNVVLSEIARCEAVVSTSLHGLITADAYGIPAVWARREPPLRGGQFKFMDYESTVTPGRTRLVDLDSERDLDTALRHVGTVDSSRLMSLQDGLLRALAEAELPETSPATALLRLRR